MKTLALLYHIALADFLERSRRYSFLIMLGLVLYLGYLVNIGQITLRLETYRGLFNSAWVGSMMTLVVTFFLGWFGFFLVKNAIARDYDTGVGQIMATTPISRPMYVLGKWLSNVVVLNGMVLILMLAAIAMQFIQREDPQLHLWALIAPFLFVAMPFMALVAAMAVLFESIGWLRGGLGNVVYFLLFILGISVVAILYGVKVPLLDWLGFGLFKESMAAAAHSAYPDYQGGLTLSMVPPSAEILPFNWSGVTWALPVILPRLAMYAAAIGLALLGALFFDRFDTSRARRRGKSGQFASPDSALGLSSEIPGAASGARSKIFFTRHLAVRLQLRPRSLLLAELRLVLQTMPWWWYPVAAGLIVASLLVPLDSLLKVVLPAALIWPLLVWSGLGCAETRYNTGQMVFSAPHPLRRQLPRTWLAGLMVTTLMAAPAAIRFAQLGQWTSLAALVAGVLWIPSLALALGVWTSSSKAFEVIYVVFWYLGVLNDVSELDYLGLHTSGRWPGYLALSFLLFAAALVGRRRQLHR